MYIIVYCTRNLSHIAWDAYKLHTNEMTTLVIDHLQSRFEGGYHVRNFVNEQVQSYVFVDLAVEWENMIHYCRYRIILSILWDIYASHLGTIDNNFCLCVTLFYLSVLFQWAACTSTFIVVVQQNVWTKQNEM